MDFTFEINSFIVGIAAGIALAAFLAFILGLIAEKKNVKKTSRPISPLALDKDSFIKALCDSISFPGKKVIVEEYIIKEIISGEVHTIKSENDIGLRYSSSTNTFVIYQLFFSEIGPIERAALFLPASKIIKTKFKEIDTKPVGN